MAEKGRKIGDRSRLLQPKVDWRSGGFVIESLNTPLR